MKITSTPDLARMDKHELAALQNEVLKGVAQAREVCRKGQTLDQEISRARTQRRVMRQHL